MRNESVSIEYAKSILRVVSSQGHDIDRLLEVTGCSFNPLDPESATETEIPTLQYCELLRQYLLLSRGNFLGLPVLNSDVTGGFRVMCFSVIHSENLEVAINRSADFYQLCADPAWRFYLTVKDDRASIVFEQKQAGRGERISAYDLCAWHRFWAWLTGRYIDLVEVNLTEKTPVDQNKYHRLFDTKVNFSQSVTSLSFDAKYLQNSIVHTEQSVEEFLTTAPYQLITMPRAKTDSLTEKIRYIIGCDFTKTFPTYENVSEILHMSTTTLRRKLIQEGTTYQAIKDDARRDASIAYLSQPELTINNIAYLMGFIDPSAFSRTFKRWTSMPPGLYRRRYLGIGDEVQPDRVSGGQEAANAAVIKLQLSASANWPRQATS